MHELQLPSIDTTNCKHSHTNMSKKGELKLESIFHTIQHLRCKRMALRQNDKGHLVK